MTIKNGSEVSSSNENLKISWMKNAQASPIMKSFIAGTLSGTFSTLLLQPFDLVKTRLQKSANIGSKLGMIGELKNVIKQEKVFGLWNGLIPSLWRCVPGIGLYFASLQWIKSTIGSSHPHPLESLLIGASARTVAGTMVLPFTVIKTRYEGPVNYFFMFHTF